MRLTVGIVISLSIIFLSSCVTSNRAISYGWKTRADVYEIRGRGQELASKNWLTTKNYAKTLQLLTAAATNYYHSDTLTDPTPYLRSMNAVATILENITISVVSKPDSGFVQQGFSENVVLSISNSHAIPEMFFQVEYRQQLANKTTEVQTEILSSNAEGLLEFSLPNPLARGQYRILVTPYNEHIMETANSNFSEDDPIKQEFMRKINTMLDKKSINIYIPISSRASRFATLVYVYETDIASSHISSDATSTGITDTLAESGFEQTITIDQELFSFSQLSDLREHINKQSISADRIIYGTASIENFTESAGGFSVSVTGSVQVISANSGRVLTRARQKMRIDGTTASGTIYNAFNTMGRRIAEMLLISMP